MKENWNIVGGMKRDDFLYILLVPSEWSVCNDRGKCWRKGTYEFIQCSRKMDIILLKDVKLYNGTGYEVYYFDNGNIPTMNYFLVIFVKILIFLRIIFFSSHWTNACFIRGTTECCPLYHKVDNRCQACPPGYFGHMCKNKCPFPSYGLLCRHKCNCSEVNCNHISGCPITTVYLQQPQSTTKLNKEFSIPTSAKMNRNEHRW
ncbi:uncharacterized protein LOC134267324 [Saccostrea cucullata]|uniref:uncharacterized protein LOC134267324 n=1 Tax=Saccostrea cuccullata TaxID=36930 RepID=UPI002ED28D73